MKMIKRVKLPDGSHHMYLECRCGHKQTEPDDGDPYPVQLIPCDYCNKREKDFRK